MSVKLFYDAPLTEVVEIGSERSFCQSTYPNNSSSLQDYTTHEYFEE